MIILSFTPVKAAEIEKLFEQGLFALQEQVLTDCNYYVRVDQGILRDSARTEVEGEDLTITYDTPYAKKVYYTGTPSTDKNKNASLQWCEVAANNHSGDWAKIIEKAMNG